ncbi:MAG: hypothetical protein HZC47_00200 [Methanobacterium sp.]|uniref:hypothetical protein n=1 Tax=Methanobacterium sp. TaxID=2164 RepID=UPI003D650921|nr:hypothetical protein [Methanobacterium sp.]
MEYVKGSVIYQQESYKRKLKSGKIRRYSKERYQIIIDEENIFQNQDMIIIMREKDFNNLSDHINDCDAIATKNNDLKSTINELKNKIRILEEYNRYLELDNKVHSKRYKSNYFTQ